MAKIEFKFDIGQLVRYHGSKAQVIDRWWDEDQHNRYTVQYVVGSHLNRLVWSTIEQSLEEYETNGQSH